MKETRKEYKARWYREHSEVVKARAVKWAKDNPEKERARKAQYGFHHTGLMPIFFLHSQGECCRVYPAQGGATDHDTNEAQ